jgi:hypothetical protein
MVAAAAMPDVCHRENRLIFEGSSSGSDSAAADSISGMQRWISPVENIPVVVFSRRASPRFHPRLMHCDPEILLQSLCIAAADAMRPECPRDLCPKLQTIPA